MRKIKNSADNFRKEVRQKNKSVLITYFSLRIIVLASLIISLFNHEYESAFVCGLTLILFLLPVFMEKNFKIKLPSTLEVIMLLFVFASVILGELSNYYIQYPHWDTVLHTLVGFISAAWGYGMIDLLNRKEKASTILSPISMAVFALCFSMTIGVFWEFFEFGADRILGLDMQKDTVISEFSSVALDKTYSNSPVKIDGITDVSVNDKSLEVGGYLDIGLYDTMEDLFVNFIGALFFSVIGYISSKTKKGNFFTRSFVPVPAGQGETDGGSD